MPRVFVIFRTFDRIWTCKTLTRELAPFEMDMSGGPIKFVFTVDHISPVNSSNNSVNNVYESNTHQCYSASGVASKDADSFYCDPHERFSPCIVRQSESECEFVSPKQGASPRGMVRRFSMPNDALEIPVNPSRQTQSTMAIGEDGLNTMIYFVLPTFRCTLLLDAHVASCVQCEYSRSKTFRRHLMRFLCRGEAFRNCIPDYQKWSDEEKESWENFLLVPYLIDVVAVWPKQKIDYAWCSHILGTLSKHVVLEEGFAWLSTLGGAHSSLGETFQHHAKRAGEISSHQLRLALQLGNESLIARCYVFWSWSLMQRGHLTQCKRCILTTWTFCKTLKCRDRILENMCKAVWSRLRYRRAQRQGLLAQGHLNGCASRLFELRDDSSDSETDCDKSVRKTSLLVSVERASTSTKAKDDEGTLEGGRAAALVDESQVYEDSSSFVPCGCSKQQDLACAKKSQRLRSLSPTVKVW
ncbi:hypothetical protein EGW08_005867 [Elysia chlorotica]|uniref:Uncharacterized protein n=1 Tax=Elysia chlorotica TaxID=188477 RepID=A0A3S1BLB4_ELYCH|nr:hypothetical protein EGW08_005867 [Elysia chlorotica]